MDRSPFVNIDSTTVAGIQRAKDMGFADAGLADVVVSPFVYEMNDLFTDTAKGRFFSVFRHRECVLFGCPSGTIASFS